MPPQSYPLQIHHHHKNTKQRETQASQEENKQKPSLPERMATISAGLSISSPSRVHVLRASSSESSRTSHVIMFPCVRVGSGRMVSVGPVRTAPERISEKVAESIKNAQETCSEDPASGECVAAWDEVEELSAAASHARDRKKGSDPLEDFCKDNPETIECKTHDN